MFFKSPRTNVSRKQSPQISVKRQQPTNQPTTQPADLPTDRPTERTNKQSNKQTNKQTNKQASKQANKQTSKQTNKQEVSEARKSLSTPIHIFYSLFPSSCDLLGSCFWDQATQWRIFFSWGTFPFFDTGKPIQHRHRVVHALIKLRPSITSCNYYLVLIMRLDIHLLLLMTMLSMQVCFVHSKQNPHSNAKQSS